MVLDVLVLGYCSGFETAQEALQRRPGVKILLTSTSPKAMWPADAVNLFDKLPRGSCAFLPKPFTSVQLRTAVYDLLGGVI